MMRVRAASADAATFRCPGVWRGREAGTRCQHQEPRPERPVGKLSERRTFFSYFRARPRPVIQIAKRRLPAGKRHSGPNARPHVAEDVQTLRVVEVFQRVPVVDLQTYLPQGHAIEHEEMDRQALSVIGDTWRRGVPVVDALLSMRLSMSRFSATYARSTCVTGTSKHRANSRAMRKRTGRPSSARLMVVSESGMLRRQQSSARSR